MMTTSFAYCRCFLSQNIFIHQIQRHLRYVNDAQFKKDYEASLSSKCDQVLCLVKEEIKRRINLRENVLQRLNHVQNHYKPLHPEVYQFNEKIIQKNNDEAKTVGPEVFAVPVFKKDFIKKLLEELEHFKTSGIPHEQPNSMNHHGIILDEIGFKLFFDQLRYNFIQPLARKLFNDPELVLDSHRAFVVKYGINEDLDLAPHFDNAEITLNVALSEDYQGGELVFHNSNSGQTTRPTFGYEHEFCHGVIHKYVLHVFLHLDM